MPCDNCISRKIDTRCTYEQTTTSPSASVHAESRSSPSHARLTKFSLQPGHEPVSHSTGASKLTEQIGYSGESRNGLLAVLSQVSISEIPRPTFLMQDSFLARTKTLHRPQRLPLTKYPEQSVPKLLGFLQSFPHQTWRNTWLGYSSAKQIGTLPCSTSITSTGCISPGINIVGTTQVQRRKVTCLGS